MGTAQQTLRARLVKRTMPTPPRVKAIRRRRFRIPPSAVIHAIMGSYGTKVVIAERLGVSISTFTDMLNRPGYEAARERYEHECERLIWTARNTVVEALQQRLDMSTALRAATYVLDRKDPEFKPKTTTVVEGGDRPLRVQQAIINIPVEFLQAPPEEKRAILQAIENGENPEPKGIKA